MRKPLAATLALAAVGSALAAGPAVSANRAVSVRDNAFAPTSLSARTGDTLVFRWAGSNPHNVRAASGPVRFNSGTPKTSGTYRVRVRRAGAYRIVCDVHPQMTMRLRVR
jgi:plastocyanin